MLKKLCILCLLLGVWAIGETDLNLLKLAITSWEKGFTDLSIKYLEEFIASNPSKYIDYAHLLYGHNLIKEGKYKEGIEKLEILIHKFPLSPYVPDAYKLIIFANLKIDNILKSIELYKEFEKNFGKNPEIENSLTFTLLEKGIESFKNKDFKKSKFYFSLINENFQNSELIDKTNYFLGLIEFEDNNFNLAKEYFLKTIKSNQKEISLNSYLKLGDCYFNLKDYENAEKYYREIENKDGIFSEWARYQLSLIEKRKGNIERSLELLNKIDYTGDENLKFLVLNEKSSIYILKENWDKAKEILFMILKETKDEKIRKQVYFKLGIVEFNLKNYEESIVYFDKVIDSKNGNIEKERGLFLKGYIYYLKNDKEIAFKIWDRLKLEFPDSIFLPQILFLKGKKLFEDNKLQEAEQVLKEYINFEKNTFNKEAHFYLIEILIKEGKLEESEEYVRKILTKEKDIQAEFYLGKILFLKGNLKEAESILKDLNIKNQLLKVECLYYLGEIYRNQKNFEKAREKFIEIISLYPQYKEWKEKAEKSLQSIKN